MKKALIFLAVFLLLAGCGKEQTCFICKTPIQEGEHVVLANNSNFDGIEGVNYGKVSMEDVICENCQLKYTGKIAGHCNRCLQLLADDERYHDEEIGNVCESCATELWGNDKEQYAVHEWVCESCHIAFGDDTHKNITASYESGICDNCYEQIFG